MYRLVFILLFIIFFASTPRAYSHSSGVYDFDSDGVTDASDCNPDDPGISQLMPDAYGDGIDSNCDGADGIDSDGDGYPTELDCNERNSAIYPDATEIPGNGIDEDGDGMDWAG
jgi:hypothetical protein